MLNKSQEKTLAALKAKARIANDGARMPSIKRICALLEALGFNVDLSETVNVVEYRSKGRRYVNSRHDGKRGYKLQVFKPGGEKWKPGSVELELDTSDSYYSWNSRGYAQKLLELIERKEGGK